MKRMPEAREEKIQLATRLPFELYQSYIHLGMATGINLNNLFVDAARRFTEQYPESDEYQSKIAKHQHTLAMAIEKPGSQQTATTLTAKAGAYKKDGTRNPDIVPMVVRVPSEIGRKVTSIAFATHESRNNTFVTALEHYIEYLRGSEELREAVSTHLAEIGVACNALGVNPLSKSAQDQ